jgi:predicted nucleotidyltransferase
LKKININKITEVLAKHSWVDFAYLFGSGKEGLVKTGSDLDLGIYLNRKCGIDDLAKIRADLQETLHFEDVDIVILNDASPVLRFEAVSGNRIFSREKVKEAEFASITAREYEDETAMLNKALSFHSLLHKGTNPLAFDSQPGKSRL